MLAAVYTRERGGLVLKELPRPEPSNGEVLVRVRYAGICGSDLSLIKSGNLPDGAILGHEMSGQVDKVGPEVEGLTPGQGVIVRPRGCGVCPACLEGKENLCPKRETVGLGGRPGAFAQWMLAAKEMIIPVPGGLELQRAALAEPLATALHALRDAGLHGSNWIVVLGGGGIGACTVAVLRAMGHERILVVEPDHRKKEALMQLGAQVVVDPHQQEVGRSIEQWSEGWGADAVIECAGRLDTMEQSLALCRVGGEVIWVGMPPGTILVAPSLLVLKHITIRASFGNTQTECLQCMQWMAQGRLGVDGMVVEEISLEGLPGRIEGLLRGHSGGKVIVNIP